ncbi:hypothetical protein KHX94_17880 [Shewanella dokdonensis]|uniref:Threonine efflux protein n=1 Tax=Shewanella dokdonensis TaxID=712036 RepID=A0ABX8DE16_9GAMM|nr:hypothetical protein [Shewanella dokdonensis]QVK22982.1 hypothetical protein KHX94_17880 [Shewanella dokdonensis]
MSWLSLLFTLGTVHVAALVAPGPDFALMLRASVVGGAVMRFSWRWDWPRPLCYTPLR